MATENVHVIRTGRVAQLVLDRVDRKNAFNGAMWAALDRAIEEIEGRLPRVVVITGAGTTAFCAGMDVNPDNPQISRMADALATGDPVPVKRLIHRIRGTIDRLAALPVPVVAAINGDAHGGGAELAVRCDLRVMDPKAVIRFSEVRLGLMPDWGGGAALTRLIGPSRAADLILTARPVNAPEALALGLVNRVSPPQVALAAAMEMAETIAANGPKAVRHALKLIRQAPDLCHADALDLETEQAVALIATGECLQGIGAFLEKKTPVFTD
ncbi:MAG: enoyl-CoA hydratase/isomerase family protein [Desulfobacterales bacterium]|nr:enoyl-CoA hydratase/isomerase family protein [Desulfobacterales bacterium]